MNLLEEFGWRRGWNLEEDSEGILRSLLRAAFARALLQAGWE